mmetsp:Transcript_53305/g.103061  ORF Transcript_53305/g.103061 Transcript_53305/m.103061 type:complete len:226 (-) Transcript_53305:218-895(-)
MPASRIGWLGGRCPRRLGAVCTRERLAPPQRQRPHLRPMTVWQALRIGRRDGQKAKRHGAVATSAEAARRHPPRPLTTASLAFQIGKMDGRMARKHGAARTAGKAVGLSHSPMTVKPVMPTGRLVGPTGRRRGAVSIINEAAFIPRHLMTASLASQIGRMAGRQKRNSGVALTVRRAAAQSWRRPQLSLARRHLIAPLGSLSGTLVGAKLRRTGAATMPAAVAPL